MTVDEIAYHTRCVSANTENALVIADMPFMSYSNVEQCCESAAKMMRAGAGMVKMEGGRWLCDSVTTLVRNGIPVCGHLGLTPQSVNVFGGFKIQGREDERAEEIYQDALALVQAGIQLLVLECVPSSLAKKISQAITIPVIGIGAGKETDGQILVMHDALGITSGYIPKFSKNFLAESGDIQSAISLYVAQVASGEFPGAEHSFS